MATKPHVHLCQVVFPSKTGMPRDSVVNTLWFIKTDPVDETESAALGSAVRAAYTSSTGMAIAGWMSGGMSGIIQTRVYHWVDPLPRTPDISQGNFSPTSAEDGLPEEVAACLSFKVGTDSAPATRRGRIFLGPLRNVVVDYDENLSPRLHSVAIGAFVSLGQKIFDNSAAAGFTWAVYSRKMNEALPVGAVWVDHAFDTQRRRGQRATARTVQALS